jgi:hypothetical protein
MRLSVDSGDAGYAAYMHGGRGALVFLDGVKLNYVLTADEEMGLAVVHKTDEAGNIVHCGGVIQRETLHGAVRIELPA